MKKIVCMFPGQGSQKEGMGIDLFDAFPKLVDRANDILGYDIKEICLNNHENKLNQTQYTQPIVFVVNSLSYFRFFEERGTPDIVLGHSLGEFNALLAAEVFDFETGLNIVKKRGELMGEVENGGMAAIIGLSLEEVSSILHEKYPELDVANINAHNQIVISGPKQFIQEAQETFEDEYAGYVILKVSGAFHSRYIKPVQNKFSNFLKYFNFSKPKIEVISNIEACPYSQENITYILESQLSSPVLWKDSIEYLLDKYKCDFIPLGRGKVLTNLLEKIQKQFNLQNNYSPINL